MTSSRSSTPPSPSPPSRSEFDVYHHAPRIHVVCILAAEALRTFYQIRNDVQARERNSRETPIPARRPRRAKLDAFEFEFESFECTTRSIVLDRSRA